MSIFSSGSRGGPRGPWPPPGPVKIGHKKDGRQRQPHRFHVSQPPPYPAAGSATDIVCTFYENEMLSLLFDSSEDRFKFQWFVYKSQDLTASLALSGPLSTVLSFYVSF